MRLGGDSYGIVHLDELLAIGYTTERIRWMVRSGRWQRVLPRVYATFSGPLHYRARLHAALRYAGDGAVLSYETAGHEYGLNPRPPLIHLTVGYDRVVAPVPGVKVHRSRTLTDADVWHGEVPLTRIERTVLDLLGHRRDANGALALIADAVRSRRTTHLRLRDALDRAPHTKWRSVVLEALPDVGRGAMSLLEIREAKLRRQHGLPAGERQIRRDADGVEYLDVIVEKFRIHTEVDGRLGHDRAAEEWRDMRRDNRSEVLRYRHLRYGAADLFDRGCEVMAQQAEILRQQGWAGPFRRCRRCQPAIPKAS